MRWLKKLHCVTSIIVVFCAGCWKHQDHQVTRPDIPFYHFGGRIVDLDSDSALAGVRVVLTAVTMVYDVDFDTASAVSDSAGNFMIYPVYPGKHFLHFVRDNYPIGATNVQINYVDRSDIYRLPRIFFASRLRSLNTVYSGKPMAINSTTCWFLSTEIMQFSRDGDHWVLEKTWPNILQNKNIKACTIVGSNLYVAQAPDSIIVINRFDGSLVEGYAVSANLTGLALDKTGNRLYSCSREAIYLHDETISGIAEIYTFPLAQMEALAWKDGLYSYDNSEQVLKMYDSDMQVIATFALIDTKSGQQIDKIVDMDFDAYGNLWISGY